MASDRFNETHVNSGSITCGKAERCFRVLEGSSFLGWEVAGPEDSFGASNKSDGIEMIFGIKGPQTDPYHRVQGEGFVRVNPELYEAAIDYCKISAPGAVERMQNIVSHAGALLTLPIGGGQIVRPYGAHDNGDYSLAKQSDFDVPSAQRSAAIPPMY
jgi:hypothetical protein